MTSAPASVIAGPVLGEDVRARQHPLLARLANHLDFLVVAHSGLLEVLPVAAVLVDESDRREVLDAREAAATQVFDEHVHVRKGISAVDAGEHRRVFDDGNDLVTHLDHDFVGVAVRQEAGEGAATVHPVASRVVDDEEVDAAALRELGGDAGTGTGTDDRVTVLNGLSIVESDSARVY